MKISVIAHFAIFTQFSIVFLENGRIVGREISDVFKVPIR